VAGHLPIGGVHLGVVAASLAYPGGKVVGDEKFADSRKISEHPDVGGGPVGQRLGPGGFGEGEIAGPEHTNEDLGLADLAGLRIHHRHRLAGVVHEDLLSGLMLLAQNRIDTGLPLTEEIAEPAVLVAIAISFLVLEPQQVKRDAFAAEFGVNVRAVGSRP